ncbi:MAG: hypothetical protein GY739_15075, partial [Mesoflavibacter sp.]|nr:hypothetical protein [Mesoflavibacter sp.]
ESNKLAVLDNSLPLKAYPEKDLNTLLETQFKFWLSNLLSLKADQNDKVNNALPAIKKHCWSMGLDKVKKMFEMYIDSELSIKPMSNHFDRVLVGQIYQAYKSQERTKVVKVDINKEKQIEDVIDCITYFDMYVQRNKLPIESSWLYDYLTDCKKVVTYTDEEKRKIHKIVLVNEPEEEKAKQISKLKLVYRYFDRLII